MSCTEVEDKLRTRSAEELSLQMDGLVVLSKVLNATLDRWFLSGGTLLGAYRDGDFIPWDWDAENIALGIPEEQIDHKQVARCARMAQVHDFTMQGLPQQYATQLGERGVRLSGGQQRRIGIARALYHNPEVLIFDEATSALDTVTEQAVMLAIDNLHSQKTMIIIAHRLSTVRNCDKIVLLDNGCIKAQGSFEQLSQVNSKFNSMTKA